MAIPGNVGGKKSTFSSPAAMAQAQRAAETQSMKALQDRREQTRKDFFKGRQDISNNRLDRRQIQSDLYEKFKQEQMKPVVGASNVYQSRTPGGPTLADEAMRLANMYGPTFKEIGSDIGYGLGSIGKGIGDFIGRGGVLGSVASDLFQRIKSGTQQGIETVGGLYDNLRSAFSGQPTVNYGGGSTITTTTNQPAIDLTPASIETETLPSMDLNRNIGNESDPSIFGIDNAGVPLPYNNISSFNPDTYQPGYLPEGYSNVGVAPVVPEYYDPNNTLGNIYLESIGEVPKGTVNPDLRSELSEQDKRKMLDRYLFDKMIQEEINRNKQQKFNRDMQMYQTDPTGQPVLMAENVGLPSLMDLYNFAKNPQVETPMGNLRFDNVLSGNPQLGYENTVMINGVPVDLNATIGNQGLSVGGSFSFKKGGSVDKYAGLGYKLK
jgi:hypothetical protein